MDPLTVAIRTAVKIKVVDNRLEPGQRKVVENDNFFDCLYPNCSIILDILKVSTFAAGKLSRAAFLRWAAASQEAA